MIFTRLFVSSPTFIMHQIRLLFYAKNSATAAGTSIASISTSRHPKTMQQQLASRIFQLDTEGVHKIRLQLQQTKQGHKRFKISKIRNPDLFTDIATIFVPEEAYKVMRALDELVDELPDEKPPNPPSDPNGGGGDILASKQIESGRFCDFLFEVAWHTDQWQFHMHTVSPGQTGRRRFSFMPLKALPWLRHEMAIMLANHDAGSSGQIEMAPTMPKWILGRVEQPRQTRQQERDAPADEQSTWWIHASTETYADLEEPNLLKVAVESAEGEWEKRRTEEIRQKLHNPNKDKEGKKGEEEEGKKKSQEDEKN